MSSIHHAFAAPKGVDKLPHSNQSMTMSASASASVPGTRFVSFRLDALLPHHPFHGATKSPKQLGPWFVSFRFVSSVLPPRWLQPFFPGVQCLVSCDPRQSHPPPDQRPDGCAPNRTPEIDACLPAWIGIGIGVGVGAQLLLPYYY
uniref:Uncharacterized protein n=1 Tax=Pseudo-nitzschia australis TaxID=44445 RepID=A0A7S4EL96_9STRA